MAHESNWRKLIKPQFVERDRMIPTLFGVPAAQAASIASGAALFAALLVIPAVFMAASKDSSLKNAGIWLGYFVWAVFVSETLVFIRLEKRVEGIIACETAKRAKGIEVDYVIFATLNENIKNNEMYVGASRARTNLVIVGPNTFRKRFSIS